MRQRLWVKVSKAHIPQVDLAEMDFISSFQQVVTTTGGSQELQNLAALRGEITDLLLFCNRDQVDGLKALKDPSHCGLVG